MIEVIDSHTAGEPTRVILRGGPDLGAGPPAARAARLEAEHRDFCNGVLCEPRGHEALVGALLMPPEDRSCAAAVIYFNTLGNLGMCGHATIGLAVTLHRMGRIGAGRHRIETPVGVVEVHLHDAHTVSVENVESYRLARGVEVTLGDGRRIVGDVAWGGNWFFLVDDSPIPIEPANIRELSDLALGIRAALERQGITGRDGAWIDHVELFGPPADPAAHARNFVLCPGGAYDRSPCGTGCSARLACLAADDQLRPGEEWVQEGVIGSRYRLHYRPGPQGGVIPTITGQAFVTAKAQLLFEPEDPYATGIGT